MIAALKRFFRQQDGSGTVEVALLFPVVIAPFMLAMETGFIQMRQVMMDRAMDVVVRDLRLGNTRVNTADKLKEALCAEILIAPRCLQDLRLEMSPVAVADFQPPADRVACVDREEEVAPITAYTPGASHVMMMLRFCLLHDPILPGTGLGRMLPKESGGGIPLIAYAFYVTEP